MIVTANNRNTSSDPYTRWFHNRAADRPLNAYQLLGVRELETNGSVIQAALQRCREELERHRATTDEANWQEVAAQIEQAGRLLTDIACKAIVDAAIRRAHRAEELHSAPHRMQFTGELHCPGCRHENAGGRGFCAQCGTSLWVNCGACDSHCPAHETYCGGCGANLREAEQRLLRQSQQSLDDAIAMHGEGRLDEALELMLQLAIEEDPRVGSLATQAAELYFHWREEVGALRRQADDACTAAEADVARGDFETAMRRLEAIPAAIRGDRADAILCEAQARMQEIEQLENEITAGIASKSVAGLGSKIDRFLTWRPEHEPTRRLAARLGIALQKAAERKIAEGQFERALQFLEDVPQAGRNEQHQELEERAAELLWIEQDLAGATHLDATLVSIAERLVVLRPRDRHAAQQLAALRNLKHTGCKNLPGARKELRLAGGPTLQFVDSWQQIDTTPVKSSVTFDRCWQQWNTACGLALQGLAAAPLSLNLAQQKRGSFWESFGTRRQPIASRAWGIDLGNASLKALELTREGDRFVATRCFYAERPRHFDGELSESRREEAVLELLRQFADQHDVGDAKLCFGFPMPSTLTRMVRMPRASDKQLRTAITYEAKRQFPIPLEQLAWDWQILSNGAESSAGSASTHCSVVLIAARRELMAARQAAIESTGLRVDVFQSSGVALWNLAAKENWFQESSTLESGSRQPVTAILDLGASGSNLILVGAECLWCRSLAISGDGITRALSRHYRLKYEDAERLKCEPWRTRRMSELYGRIEPMIRELSNEVMRSIEAFHKEYTRHEVIDVRLTGGGAELHSLLRLMAQER